MSQTREMKFSLSFEIKASQSHEPLSHVVCRVLTPEGALYAYSIANEDGKLTVSARPTDSIEFALIGYSTLKSKAGAYTTAKTNVVFMTLQEVQLREVSIKAPPISARSDTLAYNVASFVGRGDAHLEDVLKKLPGIKVADNGAVTYQGKAINKFYIEGRDLLGSSYNQATRNMPIEAVTTVEVLENHQPVKILQGRRFTDKAALNIKLDKKHKLRPFGEIEGSVGVVPTRWNNRLFLTQILGKTQLLVTAKMNNVGEDLSGETQEHIDVTDLDAYEPITQGLLSLPMLNMETIPQRRYVHNNSYAMGVNYLVGVSENATLRTNVLFYRDRSGYATHETYRYGGVRDVVVDETNDRLLRTLTVMPILKYELNNEKAYVADEMRYSFSRTSADNALVSNGTGISENIISSPRYLQNYFTSTITVGGQMVQAKSLLRYLDRRESLADVVTATPTDAASDDSVSLYNVDGRYAIRSLIVRNKLSTSFQFINSHLDLGMSAAYRSQTYGYAEDVRHEKTIISLLTSYTLLFGQDRSLTLELPVSWMHLGLSSQNSGRKRELFVFLPNFNFRYKLDENWKLSLSAYTNTDNLPALFYSAHVLRTDYRSIYIPNNDLFLGRNMTLSARANYRNLLTMVFANLSVSYTDEKRESYANYTYTDALTSISYISGNNHRRRLMVDARLDKSFTDIGLTMKSAINYNETSYLLSQSVVKIQNHSNILAANIDLTYQKLKWLRVNVGVNGTVYWERNDLHTSDALSSWIANAAVYIFPMEKIDIKMSYENHTNEVTKSNFATSNIFDIKANAKLNKRFEIGASVTNLFDVKTYTVTQNTGINTYYTSLPLRGREFLLRLLYRW